jgi:hypothetical protein
MGMSTGDERAAAGRALDPEPAVEYGEPIREPHQAAPIGTGASDAVVAHLGEVLAAVVGSSS